MGVLTTAHVFLGPIRSTHVEAFGAWTLVGSTKRSAPASILIFICFCFCGHCFLVCFEGRTVVCKGKDVCARPRLEDELCSWKGFHSVHQAMSLEFKHPDLQCPFFRCFGGVSVCSERIAQQRDPCPFSLHGIPLGSGL